MKWVVSTLLVFSIFLFGLSLFTHNKLSNLGRSAVRDDVTSLEGPVTEEEVEEVKEVTKETKEESLPQEETIPPVEVVGDKELKTFVGSADAVKAVYLTSWSASNESRIENLIYLTKNTEINAVIIDVNGFSGFIAYDTDLQQVKKYKTSEVRIPDLTGLVRRLHENNIYVIARITIFQDSALGRARPDLAVRSVSTGDLWLDRKGEIWLDPAAKEVWEYKIAIAKDVLNHGVDELNFDYIRFPSDGDIQDTDYPFWDEKTPMESVLKDFFAYLRDELQEATLSVDLFGYTTINQDNLGIGQIIEHAFEYFDVVSPMVYPSHYNSGFLGLQDPAGNPYIVVYYSMWSALMRLESYESRIEDSRTKINSVRDKQESELPYRTVTLRPWLQDFDLGGDYGKTEVRLQIEATKDALQDDFGGFMLWNSSNYYTMEALEKL